VRTLIAGLAAALVLSAQQQTATPHIGYVYPAGARQGSSIEVITGGQFLNGADAAYISGRGVKVTVKRYVRPLTPAQANQLREQLQQLTEKKTAGKGSPEDDKTIAEVREKLLDFQRRPSSPAIAENAILQVTVAADAEPGERELRIDTAGGITNPIRFSVGPLAEFSRQPLKVPPAFAVVNGATPPARFAARAAEPPIAVTLPAVLNGQMMPGAADRWCFHALKGQRLVIAAAARELIPYVSDAVPGWFQAVLTLRDPAGREIASADHYRFHPDPVLYSEIPVDGDYTLEIHDSIYRGREDFVYQITIGELPYLTEIFPLGGKAGARTTVELHGWNLPSTKVQKNIKAAGVYPIQTGDSNRLPFAVDVLPETIAKKNTQRIKLPVAVNGRIAHSGDRGLFRFDGRAGEEIVAEVFARRLDSPLDSMLRLMDAKGRELAANDDFDDKGAGLLTHQADSRIYFKLPAKGTYELQVADAQGKGGPEYAYRLRVSRPEPDFELRVTPSSVNVRAAMAVPITVYALRRGGFAGDIALKLKDVPPGFSLEGAVLPAGQDQVRLTLTAPPARSDVPMAIQLEGRASIGGSEVRRLAVPAEDMMQAFAYRHLVPEHDWMVRVLGNAAARAGWRPVEQPVKLAAGGSAPVQLFVPPRFAGQVKVALNEPPEGISIQEITAVRGGISVVLRADGKVKAGLRGNLIVDAFIERENPAGGARVRRRQPLGTLPAIPFEVK
jgi:hypothetical protein